MRRWRVAPLENLIAKAMTFPEPFIKGTTSYGDGALAIDNVTTVGLGSEGTTEWRHNQPDLEGFWHRQLHPGVSCPPITNFRKEN